METSEVIPDGKYTYAKFWKCALQVNPHSYGKKYRGQKDEIDPSDYAQSLLKVCEDEKIKVVGFADHGNVEDAEIARKFLENNGIVVFPGFEVTTTEKVHWVCLFPENTGKSQLERYLGSLHLTDPQDGIRPTDLGGESLLKEVEQLGGFCYAAHVTQQNGVLKGGHNHLWKDDRLRAAQIPGAVEDLEQAHKLILQNKNKDYRREYPVAPINAKDIANPEDLKDPSAITYVKMTRPCFSSFVMAFKDEESRIRLSSDIVKRNYSKINSVKIEGGYFNGLKAEISSHLNSVIGGRGTGKSTFLECIRYALDVSHKGVDARKQGEQIVKENLGRLGGKVTLELQSAINQMKPYKVIRRYGEPPRVIDQAGNESRLHPSKDLLPNVEVYGQNEIFELAKSPGALTKVLDRFLPGAAEQEARLAQAYNKLRENGESLEKCMSKKDEIDQQIAQLPKLEEQVRLFKESGLEDKMRQVPLLEKERSLVPRILNEAKQVREGLRSLEESQPDLVFLSDKVIDGMPHKTLLLESRLILEKLSHELRQKAEAIDELVSTSESGLKLVLERLRAEMDATERQIEDDFDKLPAVAGKDGIEIGRTYQRLLREIESVKPAREKLKTINSLAKGLEQVRRNLLGEISDIRSARTLEKQATIKKLNKRLAGKLRIELKPDSLRDPLKSFLQEIPGVGARKTEWVDQAEDLTIIALVEAIRKGKSALIHKNWGLTPGKADTLARLTLRQVYELEEIDLKDKITLELNVSHGKEQYRQLERLSTGQQCTAILHLLLLDNLDPLIMDQPEDNLDNAFIAERIVQELRSAKTERQFLFATHNANIPVFGDAEWIGVCTASGDDADIPINLQGSVDIPAIRDHSAGILEGGKEAFMQRREKYGF